jgi:hypothetical protein
MRRFRFRLGSLAILVLLLGVGFAALRESDEIWDSILFSLTLLVLAFSVLLAIHRTEKRRAFWLGFALFGAAYMAVCLIPSIGSRLWTTKALVYLDSKMQRPVGLGVVLADYDNDGDLDLYIANNSQPNAPYFNNGNGAFQDVTAVSGLNLPGNHPTTGAWFPNIWTAPFLRRPTATSENFVRIGHSLMALLLAWLGGQASRSLYARSGAAFFGPTGVPVSTSNAGSK